MFNNNKLHIQSYDTMFKFDMCMIFLNFADYKRDNIDILPTVDHIQYQKKLSHN